MPPNKPLQRSGMDKVPGRGRGEGVLEQVLRARVLIRTRPAAERGCYAASSGWSQVGQPFFLSQLLEM